MQKETYLSLKHFNLHVTNGDGAPLNDAPPEYSVEFGKYQDTVDLLPYTVIHNQLYVVIQRSWKAGAFVHEELIADIAGLTALRTHGYITEQLSGYITLDHDEHNVQDCISRIISKKAPGLTGIGDPLILGGCYFPSVGSSTELVYPRAIRITNTTYEHTTADSHVSLVGAQDIIDQYCSGESIFGTRLIELIMRLAARVNITITCNLPLAAPRNITRESLAHPNRLLTQAAAIHAMSNTPAKAAVAEIPTPRKSFLYLTHYRAHYTGLAEDKLFKEVDVLVRRGVDSIDVCSYFMCGGEIYMPVKWGVRPSILVRNLHPHPLAAETSAIFLEGVAGSCEGETNLAGILSSAARESQEEVSIPLCGSPALITFDYPSAGHMTERVYRVVSEVDPTTIAELPQNKEETITTGYLRVTDIIALAETGIIKDPRLSLNAHLLAAHFKISATATYVDEDELAHFEQVTNAPSPIQTWLTTHAHTIDKSLEHNHLYRKLKHYGENELGILALTLTHDKESHFFSPMVPLFAIPEKATDTKLPFYYLHDLFHYATTGFVPLTRRNSVSALCSFEDYQRAVSGNECEAVWFSDVLAPQAFGYLHAEDVFEGDSVAKAFSEMGIYEHEAREAIFSIELHGKIPDNIKHHILFKRFSHVFVDRLLKYHVMDYDNNKGMYNYWKENITIVEVMEQFCEVFSDVAEYESYYQGTLTMIQEYPEGYSPIKAYIARTINEDIRLSALKLAYVLNYTRKAHLTDISLAIEDMLTPLRDAYRELTTLRMQVVDIDPSISNIRAVATTRARKEGVCKTASLFILGLQSNPALSDDIRTNLAERTVPFFKPFRQIDPEFMKRELARLIQENGV